ncbi:TPA: hypothetical protein NKB09_004557 [Vibrio parahaemolyticus]|nr:hypothetical protein [Vibrio parahaemolyticus]HCG8849573.1 hypothetical protein [Vibrio parahaemolyticus]
MNPSELKEIISSDLSLDNLTYVLLFLTCTASGFLGAYISSYAKEKGKNYATKEDFEQLLKQTGELTEATEQVKSEIANNSWKSSKKWELKFKIYTEVLEALASWRMSIEKIDIESFESDGTIKKDLDRDKIKTIGIKVQEVFDNLAKIEAISEIALSSEQSEAIRMIKHTATQGSEELRGHEAFITTIQKIKVLESELAKQAKSELF